MVEARPTRRLVVLRGPTAVTRREAARLLAPLAPERVLWVGPERVAPRRVSRQLGRTLHAVVFELHDGLHADALAQAEGLVQGGGAFVLCLPEEGGAPVGPGSLAVWPHSPEDVGQRLFQRVARRAIAALGVGAAEGPGGPPVEAPAPIQGGTPDQGAAVASLCAAWSEDTPQAVVLVAERGRGKSAALGLALRETLRADARLAVVCAQDPVGAAQVLRFAGGPSGWHPGSEVRLLSVAELLAASAAEPPDLLIVDEAARIPVPTLQRCTRQWPEAHVAFATTTRGYEGTGRGFVLRFLDWLAEEPHPVRRPRLRRPIRWGEDDPLEAFLTEALCLDASVPPPAPTGSEPLRIERVRPARLEADEPLLRAVFGLLVHAHYRTTPSDLHRLLDAPNLQLFVAAQGMEVVGVNLVAVEGGLPAEASAAYSRGEGRLAGHALADSFVAHLGRAEAGPLRMVRSVRIVTHPASRRRGVAAALVEHTHNALHADLFGTVFGATPGVLRFRQSLGYRLVRLGGARGERTGAPAVVMARPCSAASEGVVAEARRELGWSLPLQLDLLDAEAHLGLAPALREALLDAAPAADRGPTRLEIEQALTGWLSGPRTSDSVAWAQRAALSAMEGWRGALGPREVALVEARVLQGRAWAEAATAADLPTVRAAQRGLKAAFRRLAPAC